MKNIFLFLICFSLVACQPVNGNQTASQVSGSLKASAVQAHPSCSRLKLPRDIDDLLLQIYQTLDTPCLFDKTGDELEKAWGIKVFDFRDKSKDERDELFEQILVFNKTENALYIKRLPSSPHDFSYNHTDEIHIAATNAYRRANKGFGIGGDRKHFRLPAHFPTPELSVPPAEIDPAFDEKIAAKARPSDFESFRAHVWSNSNKNPALPQLMIFADVYGEPEEIIVYRQALSVSYPFYCIQLNKCQNDDATQASAANES